MIVPIPYRADVPVARLPIMNWAIIAVTGVFFIFQMSEDPELEGPMRQMVLTGWDRPLGFLGHMLLHGGPLHLIGNMLFLWVFGNAVCAKIGNGWFLLLYLGLGAAAGAAHVLFSGGPAIGASGAVNGVVGAYLVLYPLNDVACFILVVIRIWRFSVSGFWVILLWLGFDIWGAASGEGGVAYWAHVGGFAAGAAFAAFAIALRWIVMDSDERSLLAILGLEPERAAGPDREPDRIGGWSARMLRTPHPSVHIRRDAPAEPAPILPRASAPAQAPWPVVPAATPPVPPEECVRLRCACGKTLRVPKALSGRKARCPACQRIIQVPAL